MAVFRNVMAFLGLDDDDQMYDDDGFYEEEAEELPRRSGKNSNISVESRINSGAAQPSFGFSTEGDTGEVGGVGAVRPLRPVPDPGASPAPVPAALTDQRSNEERRVSQPGTPGAFGGSDAETRGNDPTDGGRSETTHSVSPEGLQAVPAQTTDAADRFGRAERNERLDQPEESRYGSEVADNGSSRSSEARSSQSEAASPAASRHLSVEERETIVVTHAKPRLHIPMSFDDVSRIADDFRTGSPVVMNLTKVDKPVARRLVDFASGVCYVLAGGMERVAPNVYLLTPTGIDVSAEDRRRMQERGFDR